MKSTAFFAILLFAISTPFGQAESPVAKPAATAQRPTAKAATSITVSHDRVEPGDVFYVRVTGGNPYKIQPDPRFVFSSIDAATGDQIATVTAGSESLTIVVEYKLIQFTTAEARAAPSFENQDGLLKWFREHEQVFMDSRTVIVDTGPPPKPKPDPSVDFGTLTTDVVKLAKDFPADQRATVRSVYASAAKATHATIKDRAEATSTALETGLGLNAYDDWYSFRFGLAKSLSALKAAGALTESNHAECWAAIAEGLE